MNPMNPSRPPIGNLALALCLALLAAPALAASPTRANPAQQAPAPLVPPQKNTVAPLGPVSGYASRQGVRQCLGRIDQISNFMADGSLGSGASVFLAPGNPDRGLVSVSMEVQGGNGLSFVNSAFSPSASGCDGEYVAVTYWAGDCEQVAAGFPGFRLAAALRQHIVTLDGGPNAKIYLMPAGQGCISIKKEVVY